MLTDIDADIANSPPATSPTAHLLDELQLFGWRPNGEKPDPRPLPEAARAEGAVADMVDALVATLEGTRLDADLESLLWSLVYLFHRHVGVIERALDRNEQNQQASQRVQDGSEIRSVELERLTAEGLSLIERRNAFEFMRDVAAQRREDRRLLGRRAKSGANPLQAGLAAPRQSRALQAQ